MSTVLNRPAVSLIDQIQSIAPIEVWSPAQETIRTARGVTYLLDLPGILPQNLHVTYREGRLLIWGQRNSTFIKNTLEHASDRPMGTFAAQLPISESLDPSRIGQEYQDGVLTIFIPYRRASMKRG